MQVKTGHLLLLERIFRFFFPTILSITVSRTSHGLIPTQAVSFPFCSWHVTKHCNYAYLYIPLSLSSIDHTCPHSNFLPLILILTMHQSHQQSFWRVEACRWLCAWEMKLAKANTASENRVHCSKWFAFIGGAALQYSGHPFLQVQYTFRRKVTASF